MLFYLLTGKDAFSATSLTGILSRHALGNPRRLEREMVGTCPEELSGLVHRCISLEPDARFASGSELNDALEELARSYPWTRRDASQAWQRQQTLTNPATTASQSTLKAATL